MTNQKCYLIRTNPGDNWVLHYDDIVGLDYEPGFRYTLKVKKEQVNNPPADASAVKFTLVEIIERIDVTEDIDIEDLVSKTWKLEFIRQDRLEIGIEHQIPTLKFDKNGKVTGNGGCNNFFADFTLEGRAIQIGDIGSTRKHCEGDMDLESAYFKILGLELRALFSDRKLMLSADNGNQMIFGFE